MTKGIKEKEPDPRVVYADIIDLPHYQSPNRPRMSSYDRAAQFAPFAALNGYEDMIGEEARYVDQMEEVGEIALDSLNKKLILIEEDILKGNTPAVSISYFVPDESKAGGKYITVAENIKKIDPVKKQIVLMKKKELSGINETIDMDMVSDITGELVDCVDEYGLLE